MQLAQINIINPVLEVYMKITKSFSVIFLGLYSGITLASTITPPFYDVSVSPHSSVTVNYTFNPKSQHLYCFSIQPTLTAAWHYHGTIETGKTPIELTDNNADSAGQIQIYNNSDTPFNMVNCEYHHI